MAAGGVEAVDLLADTIAREDVALGMLPRRAVESAKCTVNIADVRIIDVPVDAVGGEALGVFSGANLVRRRAEGGEVPAFEQRETLLAGEPLARRPFFKRLVERRCRRDHLFPLAATSGRNLWPRKIPA